MKKIILSTLLLLAVFLASCGKGNTNCGCESKGVLAENVPATIIDYGDYVFIL